VRRRVLALALVVVAAAVAGVWLLGRDDPLTRDQLVAYQSAVAPAVHDGGATVEKGMKPALDDLVNRHVVPPEAIAVEADGWIRDLTAVRKRVADVKPPPALRPASRLFDRSLGEYIEAARLFGDAARATPAERPALLKLGYAKATAADGHYDDASRILQRLRRRLGLGVTSQFPDPDNVTKNDPSPHAP
jgi:hypothetical protein